MTVPSNNNVNHVIIVGGGTAGWMAAASLARYLEKVSPTTKVSLIESTNIGTVGVGEATLPGIRTFNLELGIDELDFIKKTQATFKLGIQFNDWHTLGSQFFHPFADFGVKINGIDFHHFINRLAQSKKHNAAKANISQYCYASELARQGKFAQPIIPSKTPLAEYAYAYHFDALLYADYLKQYSLARGIQHHNNKVVDVTQKDDGFIESVRLDNGEVIQGDLFIDCSGFQGLLIEETLNTGYHHWNNWLPCNRAAAIQCQAQSSPAPYTKTTALAAGWRWEIPVQERLGTGYVFSDNFIDKENAIDTLLNSLPGEPLNDPKLFSFNAGCRKKIWNKNCFALGLASGFIEPLESTSISLIQTGISKLLSFFPDTSFNQADIDEVNRLHIHEMERIRDFIVLHYCLSKRDDSSFWKHCQNLDIPDTLAHKIELYRSRGHLVQYLPEAFEDASWLSMYYGFDVLPQRYDARVDATPLQHIEHNLQQMHQSIKTGASHVPEHGKFLLDNELIATIKP